MHWMAHRQTRGLCVNAPTGSVKGDTASDDEEHWKTAAKEMGVEDLRIVQKIPLDRRHRSKTDLVALERILRNQ